MRQSPPSPKAHWTAHFIFLHMRLENMTQLDFLNRSGFPRTSFQRWWKGTLSPRMVEAEAMLNVFGYELKPTPKGEP